MKKNKAILFDLDQTLLDRHSSLIRFCQWQAEVQLGFNDELILQYIDRFIQLDADGSVWKDVVYTRLKEEFSIPYTVEFLLNTYIQEFQHFCISFPYVHESIQKLANRGYKIGLVSNGRTPFQEHNFYALGIQQYFSVIIVSEAVGLRKPDSAIFNLACEQLCVTESQSVFVGDNKRVDIEGAIQAGLSAIHFCPTDENDHLNNSGRWQTINRFSQLLECLERMDNVDIND